MSWNYRILEEDVESNVPGAEPETMFTIREVYYNEAGDIEAYSAEPARPYGDTATDLGGDLRLMLRALDLPVLTPEELPRDTNPNTEGATQ